MKIIILAGGEGKRMWPIATDKCLIPFLGKPLLYHNLKQIKLYLEGARLAKRVKAHLPGVTEFVIVVNPQSKDEITKIAQSLGLNFQIAVQNEPKGMADAILAAKDFIDGEVLVVNAEDQLEPAVYQEVLGIGGADAVLSGLQVKSYFPGGYLKIAGDSSATLRTGKVTGIVEKPGEGSEPSDLVKLVVDYFKDGRKLIEYLEKVSSEKDDAYEVAMDQMITGGLDVRFARYDGVWIPLKYPWHILDITEYLLSKVEKQISPEAKISEKAVIEGNVVIEEGAKVFEGAVIKGPCYIGRDVVIGNNSMVRESNLEEESVTGFNSDITRSYIGANSWFHTNYVGDSVLEGDFGMGSGAVLANLRLDDHTIQVGDSSIGSGQVKIDSGRHKLGLIAGSGVRIGVNASIMPGVRVGANSLIGPGVVLHEDIKENTKVVLKQEYEISQHAPKLTSYDQFREKLK